MKQYLFQIVENYKDYKSVWIIEKPNKILISKNKKIKSFFLRFII